MQEENRQYSYGRTSQGSSTPRTMLSGAFWQGLSEKMYHCSRQGENGRTLVVSMDTAAMSRGGCLTHNISECPSAAAECSLSRVLQTETPQKYYLSEWARIGILERAEKKGKTLPPILKAALQSDLPYTATQSVVNWKMADKV